VQEADLLRERLADRLADFGSSANIVVIVTVPASRTSVGPPVIQTFSGRPMKVLTKVIAPASSSTIAVERVGPAARTVIDFPGLGGGEPVSEHSDREERVVGFADDVGESDGHRARAAHRAAGFRLDAVVCANARHAPATDE
jgi:hypothetical protein